MIRINPIAQPTWVDMGLGVRFLCDPVGQVVFNNAAGSPDVRHCIKHDFGFEAVFTANAVAVAKMVVSDWDGVGDSGGEVTPATPDAIEALMMQEPEVMAAFKLRVMVPALKLLTEKKAFAPLPNGSTAGAQVTANRATRRAKTAQASSTSRKPAKAV